MAHGIAEKHSRTPCISGKNVQAKTDIDMVMSGNSDVLVIPVHVYTQPSTQASSVLFCVGG